MSTIKQVADLAGVSVGTVSHVINGSVTVSEELRLRVHTAIKDLDYHPNHVARSLKTSRTRTLGIIVPDMTISFFPQLIRGAEAAARAQGYSLMAVNSDESAERQTELLGLLRSQRVEGILLIPAAAPASGEHMSRLVGMGLPLVCLDRVLEQVRVDSVSVDNAAAAALGTNHLIEMGYRRIAIVTGPLSLMNERARVRGFREAMRTARVAVSADSVWQGNFSLDDIARLCRDRLIDPRTRPEALLCTSGLTAIGGLRGVRAAGLEIPADIGFATFDELAVEDLFRPAITTIVQPAWEIGHKAADILLDRIEGRADGDPCEVRLSATLRVRESTRRAEASA